MRANPPAIYNFIRHRNSDVKLYDSDMRVTTTEQTIAKSEASQAGRRREEARQVKGCLAPDEHNNRV